MISDFLLALFPLVSYYVVCIYIQFSHVILRMNEIIFPKSVFTETRVSRDCRSALRIVRLVVPPHIRIPIIIALSNGLKISITTLSHYSEHGTILVNQ